MDIRAYAAYFCPYEYNYIFSYAIWNELKNICLITCHNCLSFGIFIIGYGITSLRSNFIHEDIFYDVRNMSQKFCIVSFHEDREIQNLSYTVREPSS